MTELDLNLDGGRRLHAYDTGAGDLVVLWHHGTPNIGAPPEPLFADGDRLGIRWIAYDRPGYGGSTPVPGRDIASAAEDARHVADALGVERFALLGHSGGSPHALACAALLPGRVTAVAAVSGLAPYGAAGLDWFGGMADPGPLRAATQGRAARERYEASAGDRPPPFTAADFEALNGVWGWFGSVVEPAMAGGPGPQIDDDLAYVSPWGFDPADVRAPVLLVHGGADRMVPSSHSAWLAEHCPTAGLTVHPDDGHISVLRHAPDALAWLSRVQRGQV